MAIVRMEGFFSDDMYIRASLPHVYSPEIEPGETWERHRDRCNSRMMEAVAELERDGLGISGVMLWDRERFESVQK